MDRDRDKIWGLFVCDFLQQWMNIFIFSDSSFFNGINLPEVKCLKYSGSILSVARRFVRSAIAWHKFSE